MVERLYRIRNPSGSEYGPLAPTDICLLIGTGRIMLDAVAADAGSDTYIPITQFPVFAKAFEARYGLDGAPRGSDSTPSSTSKAGVTAQPGEAAGANASSVPAPLAVTLPERSQIEVEETPFDDKTEARPSPQRARSAEDDDPFRERTISDADPRPPSEAAAEQDESHERTPITQSAPTIEESPSAELPNQGVTVGHAVLAHPPAQDLARPPAHDLAGAEHPSQVPTIPLARSYSPPRPAIPPASSTTIIVGTNEARRGVTIAFLSWGAIVALLYALGIGSDLGLAEARYMATSGLFYLRLLILLTAGLGLSALLLRGERLTVQSFSVSPRWALIAAGAGVAGGILSPLAPVGGAPIPIALSMTFLHAIAEETFFRGFIDRALANAFPELVSRTAIGATLFGLYFLTYASLWQGRSTLEALLWSFALTIVAGVPLSILYHRSKSFLVPLVCHLALNISMIAMSYLRG